jgi:hypothetical protein
MMVPLAIHLVADNPHRVRATACFENKKPDGKALTTLTLSGRGAFAPKMPKTT